MNSLLNPFRDIHHLGGLSDSVYQDSYPHTESKSLSRGFVWVELQVLVGRGATGICTYSGRIDAGSGAYREQAFTA